MSSLLRTIVRPLAVRAMLVREWWQSGVTYNPLSPRVYLNPYPKYAELRAKDPLHWSPLHGGLGGDALCRCGCHATRSEAFLQ